MSIEDKVIKIIAEKLSVEVEEVVPEASFVDDLGADSLDLVELIMSMEEEFDVEIWASTELSSFNFDQPTKSISYDFDDTERWVTLIIPLELLWNPYQAWMGDEKIFTHEFKVDDEHQGVSLKLAEAGNVSIVGTSVIPEFPMIIPIMLVAITMVILLQSRNRFSLR